jgi:hypothetical protein
MKIFFGFLIVLLIYGCSLEKLGSSAGKGLSSKSDTIGSNVVHGALLELTDAANQCWRKMVCSVGPAGGP